MTIHKFTIADAAFERSPGQDGDIFTGTSSISATAGRSPSVSDVMGQTSPWKRRWPYTTRW